ncbi:MAG: energy transducer TonB [Acidobacteriaceae bacterium]
MKPALFAAFALPVLCTSLLYPQATPPNPPATIPSNDNAKAAATPANAGAPEEAPAVAAPEAGAAKEVNAPAAKPAKAPEVTEAELRQRLTGRPLFLRGLWLDETLHFNMNGDLAGQSPKGSFTLCGVFVDHVRMTKKTVELEGVRFGVHFEGEAPWEEQSTSFDRIQITPKKKHQLIVIDRQLVVIPKKKKGGKGELAEATPLPPGATQSPGEAAANLRKAIDKILAPELDAKMIAEMPDYWQFFYQAQQSHKWLEPTDQTLVHPGPGVDGPRLVKNVVPESNDFAQKGEVAGVASYKVILDPQGKILAVAVYRPIGFGLDENAVAAIEKSTFAPAVKDGKPVPSVIDVAVNFRIYSKRTAGAPESADPPAGASPVTGKPSMPGIYSQAQAQPKQQ